MMSSSAARTNVHVQCLPRSIQLTAKRENFKRTYIIICFRTYVSYTEEALDKNLANSITRGNTIYVIDCTWFIFKEANYDVAIISGLIIINERGLLLKAYRNGIPMY